MLAKAFPDFCWELSESQPPTVGPNARKAAPFAGRYVASFNRYSQELKITRRPDGSFDISAMVGAPGCAGSIDASGVADGEELRAQGKRTTTRHASSSFAAPAKACASMKDLIAGIFTASPAILLVITVRSGDFLRHSLHR
jgi:hypothetical protein